jgi:penicillin amidase
VAQRVTAARFLEKAVARALEAWGRSRQPTRRGTFRMPGLAADAEIVFDRHGVPHVRADGDADAVCALGFCHALDRWLQMDMMRRVFRGRVSELVGERPLGDMALPPFRKGGTTVDADRLMRALDLVPAARRYAQGVAPEARALLDAYARGVNAGVNVLRRRRPLEMLLIGAPIEPWTPEDSALVAKAMALGLSFKWRSAPIYSGVAERLSGDRDRLARVLPAAPGADVDVAVARVIRTGMEQAVRFLPFATAATGSNAFVLGGARTRSGLPIVASDPHLELGLPGVWYLASMRGDRYRAVGCTLPGAPGIVIGRSPSLAWALTNGMIDDGDLWVEEVDGTGTRYRVDGTWRPLDVETQEIRRRGGSPLLVRVRRTHRGPLLSDAFPGYEGPPLSLRLTLHEPGREMEAFLGLGRARSADDVPRAVEGYASPAQNLLYADTAGRAGYRLIGRVPVRPRVEHPALPRDGTTSEADWAGVVSAHDMPAFDVPADGEVVSANHAHVTGAHEAYFGHFYEPSYRAARIHALLRGRSGLTPDDAAAVQRDVTSHAVPSFRRRVLMPHAEAIRRTRPKVARLLDRLLAWDGTEGAEDRTAALWHLVYHHLARRTFGPVLGEDLLDRWMALINLMDRPLLRAFTEDDSPWAPPAVRSTLLGEAIEDAERDLLARGLSTDVPWGRVHALVLRHPFGEVPLLGTAFSRGPFPMPGGPYAVASGQYFHDRPARVVVGQSYRHVVDLADPERARMITFGGQRCWIGSRHYDDLTPLWREGRWVPMRLEEAPRGRDRIRLLAG